MSRLVKKEVGEYDGQAVYYAIFSGKPTRLDIARARRLKIQHPVFSGIVQKDWGNVVLERVRDETLRAGLQKWLIGQAV